LALLKELKEKRGIPLFKKGLKMGFTIDMLEISLIFSVLVVFSITIWGAHKAIDFIKHSH
jgi:hypothetical protein